jgi:hypothetical protein
VPDFPEPEGTPQIFHQNGDTTYVTEKKRCYIEATRDIQPGSEVLVGYGGDYWRAIRYNVRLEQENAVEAGKNRRRWKVIEPK